MSGLSSSRDSLRQTVQRTAKRTGLDPIEVLSAMAVRIADQIVANSEDTDQLAHYTAAQREIEDELQAEIDALLARGLR